MRVVVIGIDGASWDPILPHLGKGLLKGFEEFWNNGLHGPLISTIPYITQPGWRSYSMGKNPGKHGVYNWFKIDWKNFKFTNINSLGFYGEDYWDILSAAGFKVGIVDMPSTFPPKMVKGTMISGFPFGDGDWTYPASFVEKIPVTYPKESTNLFVKVEDPDITMNGIERDIKSRFDMMDLLWDNDLIHITAVMNDHVSHFMWHNEKIMLRNLVANDEGIQRVLERNKDGYTILMSDHGNGPLKDEFYANEFLKKEGLLFTKDSKKGISQERVANVGTKFGLYKIARILPTGLQQRIINSVRNLESETFLSLEKRLDWKQTRAIALDAGLIYLNPLYSEEREDVITEITRKLNSVTAKNGEKLYKNILRGSEVYWGKYSNASPDIIALTNDVYAQREQLTGHLWSSDIPLESWAFRLPFTGQHRIKGIFGMVGPGITSKEISPSIYDLAPTILKLFHCEIPKDMDGKSIIE